MKVVQILLLLTACPHRDVTLVQAKLNHEIGQRIEERLTTYLTTPASLLRQMSRYRVNGGFPNNINAVDRDDFFRFNGAMAKTYSQYGGIYLGLEDGMFVGHRIHTKAATYREPGEGGYRVDDEKMQKHYRSCVNATNGEETPCRLQPGEMVTRCIDGCALQKCGDRDSQIDCSLLNTTEEQSECESAIKYCRSYVIQKVNAKDAELGYIPRSFCCMDIHGVPSETPGGIYERQADGAFGTCFYNDNVTQVQRRLLGNYSYCGDEACDNTFLGCYASMNYDPRHRPWYVATKRKQRPSWSPPYVFPDNHVGITLSRPVYDFVGNRTIFAGVLALDMELNSVSDFLVENYEHSDTTVAIIENEAPNFVIASSSRIINSQLVSSDNGTQSCDDAISESCRPIRIHVNDLTFDNNDDGDDTPDGSIIAATFQAWQQADNPLNDVFTIRKQNKQLYAAQAVPFTVTDGTLQWIIMVMSPVVPLEEDTILRGDQMFGLLLVVSIFGCFLCVLLLVLFVWYHSQFRKEDRQQDDTSFGLLNWKLTCAFIFACALLNGASLSFLGPNTDELCLLRMWLVHFFFLCSLVPLLVNAFQMHQLVVPSSQPSSHEDKENNTTPTSKLFYSDKQTISMCLPFILVQIILLTIFTFVDCSEQFDIVGSEGSEITHRLICSHATYAFLSVMFLYEGGIILISSILAFRIWFAITQPSTTNTSPTVINNTTFISNNNSSTLSSYNVGVGIVESRQLVISMCNIALVGSIVLIVSNVAQMKLGTLRMFQTVGIFWATCISSGVLVVPKLLALGADERGPRFN